MSNHVFQIQRDFGVCMVCKFPLKAGDRIAQVRITSSRNIHGYIHEHCPSIKQEETPNV